MTSLPELFAAQVARSPDGVAVIFEQEQLSYGELDRRANALAHHLRARGVGPETVVGLCLARSPAMIVGLLAILKAGGAYLPLDPHYPPQRLAFMLGDAGARVLVTHGTTHGALIDSSAAALRAGHGHGAKHRASMRQAGTSIVRLDADANAIAAMPETAPAVALDPQHPAYVIYTSGSTGTPKGVVVHACEPCIILSALQQHSALDGHARFWQSTSIGFESSVFEVFVPLLSGGRRHPCRSIRDAHADSGRELARRSGRTVTVRGTPTRLRSRPIRECAQGSSTSVLAGEALHERVVQRLHAQGR